MAILGFFNGTEWVIGPMIGGFIGELLGFRTRCRALGFGDWVRVIATHEGARRPEGSWRSSIF